jgi:hypothetical protein
MDVLDLQKKLENDAVVSAKVRRLYDEPGSSFGKRPLDTIPAGDHRTRARDASKDVRGRAWLGFGPILHTARRPLSHDVRIIRGSYGARRGESLVRTGEARLRPDPRGPEDDT